MRPLRTQVDRIDLKLLRLLQQRTELSRRIGALKRRHRALVYVPERERELLRRVARLSRGKLPARAAQAIFREILSSSRAEQGQAPIGVLKTSPLWPAVRAAFGACDRFEARAGWPQLARGLGDGSLVFALLTAKELHRVVRTPVAARAFARRYVVGGEMTGGGAPAFLVLARGHADTVPGNRALILIECKSGKDRVERSLESMKDASMHVEPATKSRESRTLLARMAFQRPQNPARVAARLEDQGWASTILGIYQAPEDEAG